jgi:hypothetical protein
MRVRDGQVRGRCLGLLFDPSVSHGGVIGLTKLIIAVGCDWSRRD